MFCCNESTFIYVIYFIYFFRAERHLHKPVSPESIHNGWLSSQTTALASYVTADDSANFPANRQKQK